MKKLLAFILCAFVFSVYAGNPGDVVISEFTTRGASSAYDEFVEIYNPTCSDVDISGWKLQYWSGASWGDKLTIPASTVLPSGKFYLMASSAAYFTTTTADLYHATYFGFAETSGGRGIRIIDELSNEIDKVLWDVTVCTANAEAEGGSTTVNHGTSANNNSVERKAFSSSTAADLASGGAHVTSGNAYDSNNNCTDFVVQTNGRNPQNSSSAKENPPGCGGDTTPPQVTSTSPSNGAGSVEVTAAITLDFGETMVDTSTSGISVSPDPGGVTYAWSNDTKTLTVNHNDLAYGTAYTVYLVQSIITDVAGNTLAYSAFVTQSGADTLTLSFTTGQYGDGMGTASIAPAKVPLNAYQSLKLTYTAALDMAGGQVSFFVPDNWTQPQSGAPASAGYVSISGDAGVSASLNAITDIGPGWEVVADITALDSGADLIFTYGDKSSGGPGALCTVSGDYEFTVGSKGSGALTALSVSPSVNVYEAMTGTILINEIAWSGTAGSYSDEWMELYNPGTSDVNVNGWKIEGIGFTDETLTGTIPAGGFYLIENDEECVSDIAGDFIDSSIAFDDAGANVILKNSSGTVIDQVNCSGGWFGGLSSPDTSMERKDPCGDGSDAATWGTNNGIIVNGLDMNSAPLIATPKAQNSIWAPSCPDNDPPYIVSTSPVDGVAGVDTAASVVITFSEEMDMSSVIEALVLTPDFSYTPVWSSGNTVLTLNPASPLGIDTEYTVSISYYAMDTAGNGLDGNADGTPGDGYTFSFNTVDMEDPTAVTDLEAYSYTALGGIRLHFTAPYENDSSGTCASYEIAYSTAPITNDTEFTAASKYDPSGITPSAPGSAEDIIINLFPVNTLFYVSVKGVDEAGKKSAFGNAASAVSGSLTVDKYPDMPLASSGRGSLEITYYLDSPAFNGDDDIYFVLNEMFTVPDTGNITVRVDGAEIPDTSYTISGSTVCVPDLTASDNVSILMENFDFPADEGNYEFDVVVKENGVYISESFPVIFTVKDPYLLTLTPAEDPHTAPGYTVDITANVRSKAGLDLFGALVEAQILTSPPGASLNYASLYTVDEGNAVFTLSLSSDAGKHIVELTCGTLTEYFTVTSFEGNDLKTPYPNPATPDTDGIVFEINLEKSSNITLSVLSLDARKVVDIVDSYYTAGYFKIPYDLKDRSGKKIPAGIYFAILKAETFTKMIKFSVVR